MRRIPGRSALERMKTQHGVYDGQLIERLLGEASTLAMSSVEQMLHVRDLREGMVVLDDVVASDGLCLLKGGTLLNRSVLKILVQWHRRTLIKEPLRVRASEGPGSAPNHDGSGDQPEPSGIKGVGGSPE